MQLVIEVKDYCPVFRIRNKMTVTKPELALEETSKNVYFY